MFEIRNSKILWPRKDFEAMKLAIEFYGEIRNHEYDLLTAAEAAGIVKISDESLRYNEILAGELGIDLDDVAEAIKQKVDTTMEWENFAEYRMLRYSTGLTWAEFIEYFNIDIIEDNPEVRT